MSCVSSARIIAVSLLGLVGLSLGCSESNPPLVPTSPTPVVVEMPPIGFSVSSVSPSAGPTIGGDYVRVAGSGFQSGVSVSLDGVAAKVTKVTASVIDLRTPPHAIGAVDVVVTNPDGQTKTLAYAYAVFSVNGSPNLVATGADLTVSWVAPSGRNCNGGGDWIAIYRVGDPDNTGATNGHSDLWYDHVCGATSGAWNVKAPSEPGDYEFRYLVGDFSVARSEPIIIRE